MRSLLLIVALMFGLNHASAAGVEELDHASAAGVENAAEPRAGDEASLGIGFDVFMQVYGFAAGRVGAPLDLQIISCKNGLCIWKVGEGVTLTTEHQEARLDLHRIEAAIDRKQPADASLRRRYEQVCLTIVAIVDRGASAADQRAAATAIAFPADEKPRRFRLEQSERDVRIYGKPAALDDAAQRCGAVAMAY